MTNCKPVSFSRRTLHRGVVTITTIILMLITTYSVLSCFVIFLLCLFRCVLCVYLFIIIFIYTVGSRFMCITNVFSIPKFRYALSLVPAMCYTKMIYAVWPVFVAGSWSVNQEPSNVKPSATGSQPPHCSLGILKKFLGRIRNAGVFV